MICQFLSCFLPLGAIPALMVKLVFRERLRDYGLVWGIVALRSRSILAPFLTHAALGIGIEWFILFGAR